MFVTKFSGKSLFCMSPSQIINKNLKLIHQMCPVTTVLNGSLQ